MNQKLLNNLSKSLKYYNYENAKFVASILYSNDQKYTILLPIVLYLDGEYARAIFFLSEMDTYTSNFYLALCYIKIKEFKKAIANLKKIINEKCKEDELLEAPCDSLFIDKKDKSFFNDILGDLYVQVMERDDSIKAYTESYIQEPLYSSIENLLSENLIPIFDENKTASPVMEYVNDMLNYYNNQNDSVLIKYIDSVPGIGSYVLSNVGRKLFDLGMIKESKKCFYLLVSKDPKFLLNMDYFSTVLWHSANITDLGILCKNLIANAPESPITWKALGNFYNHKNDYQRSVLCFKRSLYIKSEHYTNTLLGYESIQKNEYDTALSYFRRSCFMLKDNYKALFGCALVFDKMEKKELAEAHYNAALQKNPRNKHIKVLAMKFYIRKGDMDTAIRIYADGMEFNTTEVEKLKESTLDGKRKFNELEEFLILEFAEILLKLNLVEYSKKVLNIVESRGDTYYKKKEMIYENSTNK
ncbi:Protein bimA [Nosema granulosis]|uniref:Protein bimA n=1 Tax=Nosema granulosis TaxID=83296 RepID=A0A9P6KYP9_9MICR|nr:Protein bimA [Nosema granulosis]